MVVAHSLFCMQFIVFEKVMVGKIVHKEKVIPMCYSFGCAFWCFNCEHVI